MKEASEDSLDAFLNYITQIIPAELVFCIGENRGLLILRNRRNHEEEWIC